MLVFLTKCLLRFKTNRVPYPLLLLLLAKFEDSVIYTKIINMTIAKVWTIATLFIMMLSTSAFSQEGSIRGHVYDSKSGEPVMFANIILEETNIGTNTDENGLFNLVGVPVGEYNLRASFLGFEEALIKVEFKSSKINYYKVDLVEGGINIGVVDISASRQQDRTEVRISKLRVSKKQIKALPSTGGEPDILQYLQVLPGIVSTGDQGGQLYIRGGAPVQNKILLDGLTIYNPFHSIGFFSTFETEIIRNVDVLTGGFNAEHGGRISAIVDITSVRVENIKRTLFVGSIRYSGKGPIATAAAAAAAAATTTATD